MCNDMYNRKIENKLQAWLDDPSHKPIYGFPADTGVKESKKMP